MADQYGSDFITIEDEDGVEYELEILTTLDYNGCTYLAVVPADSGDTGDLEVSILKSVEENGEEILCHRGRGRTGDSIRPHYGRPLRRGRIIARLSCLVRGMSFWTHIFY